MRKLFYPLAVLAAVTLTACGGEETSAEAEVSEAKEAPETVEATALNYVVEPDESEVEWYARKVTGSHNGEVNVSEGELFVEDGFLIGGEFVMDMTTIEVNDLEDDSENENKLEGHLRTDDFFAVEQYPMAKFVITSTKPLGEDSTVITGNLTIKDITKSVSFPAKVDVSKDKVSADAKFTIDRTEWNVHYRSGESFADKMIYDEVRFEIELEADALEEGAAATEEL